MKSAMDTSTLESEAADLLTILIGGFFHSGIIFLNSVLTQYIFGYHPDKGIRLVVLFGLWRLREPLPPDFSGTLGISNDVRRWIRHDGPSPPPVVRIRSLIRFLVFFGPPIWATLDFLHFIRRACISLVPFLNPVCVYFVTTSLILSSKWRQPHLPWDERFLDWLYLFLNWLGWLIAQLPFAIIYGVMTYVLAVRGDWPPLILFVQASHILQVRWPSISPTSRAIIRLCLGVPWVLLDVTVRSPFRTVWLFLKFSKLYWRNGGREKFGALCRGNLRAGRIATWSGRRAIRPGRKATDTSIYLWKQIRYEFSSSPGTRRHLS
jgi:hypothetical protein